MYTINKESVYLIVKNIPAIGVVDELLARFEEYGHVEEYLQSHPVDLTPRHRLLDEMECEEFTDICRIKFQHIESAR